MVEIEAKQTITYNQGIEIPIRQKEAIEIVGKSNISIPEKRNYGDVMDSLKDNVKNILNNNELSRKSDLVLCLEFWNLTGQAKITSSKEHIIVRFRKDDMIRINSPESISRCRRSLARNKEVEIDAETDKYRRLREDEMRSYYGSLKSE